MELKMGQVLDYQKSGSIRTKAFGILDQVETKTKTFESQS